MVALSLAELSGSYPTSGGKDEVLYYCLRLSQIYCSYNPSDSLNVNCFADKDSVSGQYHWTHQLAPPKWGPILSWFCGYFNTVGWCVVSASINIILGQFFMAMVILCNPGITYARWQGFLVYQILLVIFTLINIFGHKVLPMLNKVGFFICITSFLIVNVTVVGSAYPKNSVQFVFGTFTNNTGWSSSGIAFIVGLTNPAFAFGGYVAYSLQEILGSRHS